MQPAQPEQGPQPVTPPEYDKGDFTGVTMPEAGEVGFGKSNDGYLGDEYKREEPPKKMPEAVVPPNTPPEGPTDFNTGEDTDVFTTVEGDNAAPVVSDYKIGDTTSAFRFPESNDGDNNSADVLQGDVEPVEDSE